MKGTGLVVALSPTSRPRPEHKVYPLEEPSKLGDIPIGDKFNYSCIFHDFKTASVYPAPGCTFESSEPNQTPINKVRRQKHSKPLNLRLQIYEKLECLERPLHAPVCLFLEIFIKYWCCFR